MRLAEALDLANRAGSGDSAPQMISLVCGFTPLHLATFLKAQGRLLFPDCGVTIATGLYGDLIGNLERAAANAEIALVLEWADLDSRLGLRNAVGCTAGIQEDILREVGQQFARLSTAIGSVGGQRVIAIVPPTIELPWLGHTGTAQSSAVELELERLLANFLAQDLDGTRVRVLSTRRLAGSADRLDAKMAISTGFPYTIAHADSIAKLIIELLFPVEPKKALVTDLDDTLWKGILGEAGVEGVSWQLSSQAQAHSLYQQALAALAESGVLIGIASKNDRELVAKALRRSDLLIDCKKVFPVEASWEAKSDSIARILKTWNIGAGDVVFVDDSPMELEEVQLAYPQMTCLSFPGADAKALLRLLERLRDLFGKPCLAEEDRIRAESFRSAPEFSTAQAQAQNDPMSFLKGLRGVVTFDYARNSEDGRALDLINKTNQFNLNGLRLTRGEWAAFLSEPNAFVVTVSYQDKFGPLGRIGVVAGKVEGTRLRVTNWVMSCRAFSRRIEHHTLARLFEHWAVDTIIFEFRHTERNGPVRTFLSERVELSKNGPVELGRAKFAEINAALPHTITETEDGQNFPAA